MITWRGGRQSNNGHMKRSEKPTIDPTVNCAVYCIPRTAIQCTACRTGTDVLLVPIYKTLKAPAIKAFCVCVCVGGVKIHITHDRVLGISVIKPKSLVRGDNGSLLATTYNSKKISPLDVLRAEDLLWYNNCLEWRTYAHADRPFMATIC